MAVIVWGLKLTGIIDEMAAFGMMIFVGGAVIAHHIDSVQDEVDRLMELERQRQDGWNGDW